MTHIPPGADVQGPVAARDIVRLGVKPHGYILFVGRLVREKGAHYLIAAFRKVDPDCRLVIAGSAKGEGTYEAELRALAGGDPRIVFCGWVRGRLLAELFSHALVYVQPSESEGLSLALLEAMSWGNLCLVSDLPQNREAIGDAGLCFEARNVDDLAEKIKGIVCGANVRAEIGPRAQRRVAEHFSWDRTTNQLEALYMRVLAKQRR
jgi:glycosyltransferase involved in cell wall biosynthesis